MIVVTASSGKSLQITFEDADGNPMPLTGYTVTLQGTSTDCAKQISSVGSIIDAPNGVVKWTGFGGLVLASDLGTLADAVFDLQVKLADAGGLLDYGPRFNCTWTKPLL